MKKWVVLASVVTLGFILTIAKICFFSTKKATVHLSESTFCEIRTDGLYHWFTDQQMPLVCWRDGREIGRVEFRFSPEWYPEAIFPTEDRENLFCFYGTDLTIALFVIELNKSSGPERSVPKGLFGSTPPIINSTTFALRRCTKDEVAHLKRSIESADDLTLRSWCVSGLPFPFNPDKQYFLTKIEHVTSPDRVPLAGEIPEVSNLEPRK